MSDENDILMLDEWRPLYAAMDNIRKIAPWQWLDETVVFGVENPEDGELGFVSVMGMLGEHLAIAVYLGAEGLYRFWTMQETQPDNPAEYLLHTPQLQASFEGRTDLHKKERDIIKQLGLKYRGKQAWPLFQSYRPGYAPWFLNGREVRFMRHVLEQTAEFSLRVKENDEIIMPADDLEYLIRVPEQTADGLEWHDEIRLIPPPPPKEYRIPMDPEALAHLRELPATMVNVDVDFFWMPTPVGEKGERPFFPYSLLLMEPSSDIILGNDILVAQPSLDQMWGSLPMKLVQSLAQVNLKPKTIRVTSEALASFFQLVADELDIDIKLMDELPLLENVKMGLLGFLGR